MPNCAQRLKEFRAARNLMQTWFAELLEISARVYSRWETGDVTPHFANIVVSGGGLRVSLEALARHTIVAVKERSETRS
ncbi:MAG: helix-turn-helix transcriptional regulator [Bryobacteraceae bacterium]|nr:helix-turn-helix transcriptional regulator [Bryobacteraceae bacterium]